MIAFSFASFILSIVIPYSLKYSFIVGNCPLVCLSSCILSPIITSLPEIASSMLLQIVAPISSMPLGIRVLIAKSFTFAPIVKSPKMFERATLLYLTSPIIATVKPSNLPKCLRIVSISSNACVGCSCCPSPAFTMCASTFFAIKCGVPAMLCLITTMPFLMLSRVFTVSYILSPFATLLLPTAIFT